MFSLAIVNILILSICVVTQANTSDDELLGKIASATSVASSINGVLVAALAILAKTLIDRRNRRIKKRKRTFPRRRRSVGSIMDELGEYYVTRAYRMRRESFWNLHDILYPFMNDKSMPKARSKKKNRNGARNGLVEPSARLSMAIRYFLGGSPPDIAIVHGVHIVEVYRSVWEVVDAVNSCSDLAISFPRDHNQQQNIAREFAKCSQAGFDNCVGAIDGLLIWIHKPKDEDCGNIGPIKFFCGRKKKYGLNMQAVCDANCRFIDLSVEHPGATSDFLAFTTSSIKYDLETPGFLAEGLALYGDNAYTNSKYMVAPFKGVSHGEKDAYNFFQSQLRIKIECAFGILVNRWGILRKPIPFGITLAKTTALIQCLCRLHNFCIDAKEEILSPLTAVDELQITSDGGIRCDATGNPQQLMHAGHHYDDVTRVLRRHIQRHNANTVLPRDYLLQIIIREDLRRPAPTY